MRRPSLGELAGLYFRIGNTTFGSGSTIIVLLSRELRSRRWLDAWQVNLFFALARVMPGTNVLAFVATSAHAVRGWPGAIVSLLSLSVPASFGIIALTLAYQRWNATPAGGAFITAAMSSIVGVIVAAAWMLAVPGLVRGTWLRTALLVSGAAALSPFLQPLAILAIAAAAGAVWRLPEHAA